MQGSFGSIVGFDGARLDALLLDEFDGREKEIHEQTPFGGVKVIEQWDDGRIVKALIPSILTDVRPVFPLDMRIIVLVIFP